MTDAVQSGGGAVRAVLRRERPGRIVFAPNLWQWWVHHRRHGTLPEELRDCTSQLELLRHLGADVLSRNLYADPRRYWFGGLCEEVLDGVEVETEEHAEGQDLALERTYRTPAGTLRERLRHVHAGSTLVQERFLVADPPTQLDALERLVRGRRWRFDPARYREQQALVGEDGVLMAGELFSPLKLLHLALGPMNTTFLLADEPQRAASILGAHEEAQLELVEQMAGAGVPVMVSMDNLDAAFHPPEHVERFSASFYERASRLCHKRGSLFLIHACGRQKANLARIAALGVDGLEGVASPPLGDVELDAAMALAGDRFLITGGISAAETGGLESRDQVFEYVGRLFERMGPYTHRWVFSSSCNTAIETPWETLLWFRDAWREQGELPCIR